MALPAAIQRQVDEAAAAEAAVAQNGQPTQNVITDPSQLAPASSEGTQNQQAPEPTPPVQAPAEDWQQKYRSLLGRHAKETAELQAATKQYESQMANMQRQIDALLEVRKQEDAKTKNAADPQDIENFGEDMIAMVQRYAERAFQGLSDHFGAQISALDSRIGKIESDVTGVTSRTEATLEQQFYAALKSVVPNWEEINADSRWLDWLAEEDTVYGVPRQAALDKARRELDVQRVANVFRSFEKAFPPKPQSSLANQVAPSSVATPAPAQAASGTKPIWSAKAVEKFYNDLSKGRYAGREAEAARLEAEIDTAAAEGRIR